MNETTAPSTDGATHPRKKRTMRQRTMPESPLEKGLLYGGAGVGALGATSALAGSASLTPEGLANIESFRDLGKNIPADPDKLMDAYTQRGSAALRSRLFGVPLANLLDIGDNTLPSMAPANLRDRVMPYTHYSSFGRGPIQAQMQLYEEQLRSPGRGVRLSATQIGQMIDSYDTWSHKLFGKPLDGITPEQQEQLMYNVKSRLAGGQITGDAAKAFAVAHEANKDKVQFMPTAIKRYTNELINPGLKAREMTMRYGLAAAGAGAGGLALYALIKHMRNNRAKAERQKELDMATQGTPVKTAAGSPIENAEMAEKAVPMAMAAAEKIPFLKKLFALRNPVKGGPGVGIDALVRAAAGVPTAISTYKLVTPDNPTGVQRGEGLTAAALMGMAGGSLVSPAAHYKAWQTGNYSDSLKKLVKDKAGWAALAMVPSAVMRGQDMLGDVQKTTGNIAAGSKNVPDMMAQLKATSGNLNQTAGNLNQAAAQGTEVMHSQRQMNEAIIDATKQLEGLRTDLGRGVAASVPLAKSVTGITDTVGHGLSALGTAAKKYGPAAGVGVAGLGALYFLTKALRGRGAKRPFGGAAKRKEQAVRVTLRKPGDYNVHYNEDEPNLSEAPKPEAVPLAKAAALVKAAISLLPEAQRQGMVGSTKQPATQPQAKQPAAQPAVNPLAVAKKALDVHHEKQARTALNIVERFRRMRNGESVKPTALAA